MPQFWRRKRSNGQSQRSRSTGRASTAGSLEHPTTPLARRQRTSATPASTVRSRPSANRTRSVPISELSKIHEANSVQGAAEEVVDEDADFLQEIVMAVNMKERGTVGCSYYVARQEKLYLMEDAPLGNADMVESLKLLINPTVVLLSTHVDDTILNILDPEAGERTSDGVSNISFNQPYLLELRPTSEFDHDNARGKLASLSVGFDHDAQLSLVLPGDTHDDDDFNADGMNGGTGLHAQMLRLSGRIALNSKISVGCAGSIISYLQRRRSARFLPGDIAAQVLFRITSLEMFALKETMYISAKSFQALQILQSESHPNIHNQGPTKDSSGSKEGLSVYGLFHYLARTPQGKYLLRQQFLRPSTNLEVISQRHETIAVLLNPANAAPFADITKSLGSIVNIRVLMIRMRVVVSGGSSKAAGIARHVWLGLQKFAYYTIGILRRFEEIIGAERLDIFNKIRTTFDAFNLGQIGRVIGEVVDFEQSAEQHRIVVKPGVDKELDHRKRLYDGINDLLTEVARQIALTVPEGLPTVLNVIFFPQIGFLITMPMDPDTGRSLWEGSEDDVWERMFTSEAIVYYKNDKMKEMDDYFGDIHSDICDKEIEIIYGLAQRVLEQENLLAVASDICGELDCLCALAQGAKQYNLHRPRMTEQNIISINEGRHILQELTVPSYVANDTFLEGGTIDHPNNSTLGSTSPVPATPSTSSTHPNITSSPTMLILTGPNYSGKSVYLKQVALAVYLAHIGSFVPCQSATIGLTDSLLTVLSTRETVSSPQSAFMTDLQQLSTALTLATNRSLLIIDEFGKGTTATDGAALACSAFEHILSLPAKSRPKVLAATHFHEIFESGFLPPCPSLSFGHMEVRIDDTAAADDVDGQITYLYNYRHGRSTASFGTICAAMNGVAREIVMRAEELVLVQARGGDLVGVCMGVGEGEMGRLQEAERVARKLLAAATEVHCNNGHDSIDVLEDILAATAEG